MRKSVKRFLSTILALTLLCSCMVVTNISTVFAAATDSWSVTADDFVESGTSTGTTALTSGTGGKTTIAASDEVSLTLSNLSNYYETFGSYGNISTDGYSWTTQLRTNGSRTITFTPAADGYITVYWYASSSSKSVTVGSNSSQSATANTIVSDKAACKADEEFIISFSSSNICLLEIDYEYAELTEYKWTLDESALTISLAGTLALGSTTTYQLTNSLSYEGSDYVLNSAYDTLSEDDVTVVGTSVTVTPQDSWFTEARKNITESAYFNASNLSGSLSNGDVFGEYFEFTTTSSSNTADRESANITSYGNLAYSYRLKLGGTNRNIKFTVTGDALIQIVFASNNDSESRDCTIDTSAYSTSSTTAYSVYTGNSNAMATPTVMTYALSGEEDGTDYYIYTLSKGINIYSINIVVGAEYADNTNSTDSAIGAYANGDSSYILAAVAEDGITAGTELTIGGTNGDLDTTDTVYTYVQIGNFVFAGSDIDDSAAYIYAGELTSSPATGAVDYIAADAKATIE